MARFARLVFFVSLFGIACNGGSASLCRGPYSSKESVRYPISDQLSQSPGNTTYFVDPVHGDNSNGGIDKHKPWRTFARVNALRLAPGDTVLVSPGVFDVSLNPAAMGTPKKPVTFKFAKGIHQFEADQAAKVSYFVSNSADDAKYPRPVGILLKDCRSVKLVGERGSELVYAGRMTEFINDQSQDITYEGLTFDLLRPTVSEFRVVSVQDGSVVIRVAEGSTYATLGGKFTWTGDLGPGWTMVQEAIPATGTCYRLGKWDPFSNAVAEQLPDGTVRLTYKSGTMGMKPGQQYQFRNVTRDTTSGFNTRCKDIRFLDCRFYALPGMGVVSQFTENIMFRDVAVVPRPGTLRTCPAWADCFHFSGCRGQILVDRCQFSGTQDDPVNVHGTFLQLVEKHGTHQVLVRFMHPQTYGFAAFQPGDEVSFVNHMNLLPFAQNRVTAIERKTDTDWLLTLQREVAPFFPGDVIDNISWYPDLTIRNCEVTMDSCRGFLVSTRGKVLVEDNTFTRTTMSAIDIADDANSWYESGGVRNVTIRNNRFIECGEPTIFIHPETQISDPGHAVHENISITGNVFQLVGDRGIFARGVNGLRVTGNQFSTGAVPVKTTECSNVRIEGNRTTRH